jgi:hypothetical protein
LSQAEAILIRNKYQSILDGFLHKLNENPARNAWDVSAAIGHNLESFKTKLKSFQDSKMLSKKLAAFYDKVWDGIRSVKQTLHEGKFI